MKLLINLIIACSFIFSVSDSVKAENLTAEHIEKKDFIGPVVPSTWIYVRVATDDWCFKAELTDLGSGIDRLSGLTITPGVYNTFCIQTSAYTSHKLFIDNWDTVPQGCNPQYHKGDISIEVWYGNSTNTGNDFAAVYCTDILPNQYCIDETTFTTNRYNATQC